jgi:hypothetical protein
MASGMPVVIDALAALDCEIIKEVAVGQLCVPKTYTRL